jgi:hypothetical protein
MKSLISCFPAKALLGWTADGGLEKTKARLSRVVGRHRAKAPRPAVLAPALVPAVADREAELEPLYAPSVYCSTLADLEDDCTTRMNEPR